MPYFKNLFGYIFSDIHQTFTSTCCNWSELHSLKISNLIWIIYHCFLVWESPFSPFVMRFLWEWTLFWTRFLWEWKLIVRCETFRRVNFIVQCDKFPKICCFLLVHSVGKTYYRWWKLAFSDLENTGKRLKSTIETFREWTVYHLQ